MLLDASITTPQNSQETYPQHPMNPGQPLQLPALFTAKSNVRALAKAKMRVVARSMWRGAGLWARYWEPMLGDCGVCSSIVCSATTVSAAAAGL